MSNRWNGSPCSLLLLDLSIVNNNDICNLRDTEDRKQNEKKQRMNPEPDTAHHFSLKARSFEDEKSLEKSFRFDDNGTPHGDKVITIRPGLDIFIGRASYPAIESGFNFEVKMSVVAFAFHLSGKQEATIERGPGKKPVSILNQRGVNTVAGLYGAKGYSRYLSHEGMDVVIIYVDRREFADIIAQETGAIPHDFRNLLQQQNLFFTLPMTGGMYNVAARALYHPYHGSASRFHLQGCGLELLALQIDRFTKEIHREKPLCRLDEERIRMAGDSLVRQMESPPTISALAAQVGVSSTKLKKGFKQVFDVSIGQFLLQHRMSRARELILNQQIDVTQAAFSVGYSNVSHFIRYYKKAFGVTPGRDKQRRGSRILP